MKTRTFQNSLALAGALAVLAMAARSQEAGSDANSSAPQLAYGVSDIVKLSQADVGEATIISYINQRGNGYGLGADQLIYLRQQGVSDAVIAAMQNQTPQATAAVQTPAAPAPAPADVADAPVYFSQPAGSVTILPAIHAAGPPPLSYPPVLQSAICVQTVPACYPVYNQCGWCSPGVVVLPGIHAQGAIVAFHGGFNHFGRSYGGRWHR